jgi:hypothetical protein
MPLNEIGCPVGQPLRGDRRMTMRTATLYLILSLALCGASLAQAEPERVFLYERRVSFVPPETFKQPSEDVIRRKFANATTPATVYANERATTSVAVSYHPSQTLSPEQLPQFKSVMADFLDKQQPGLEWLNNELVEINGVTWVHFEFLSAAKDAKIHNDMLFTSVDRRMLLFNFNSTKNEYPKYEKALEASKASIRVGK